MVFSLFSKTRSLHALNFFLFGQKYLINSNKYVYSEFILHMFNLNILFDSNKMLLVKIENDIH